MHSFVPEKIDVLPEHCIGFEEGEQGRVRMWLQWVIICTCYRNIHIICVIVLKPHVHGCRQRRV